MNDELHASGPRVSLRRVEADDLDRISEFAYSVSVLEPLSELDRLRAVHAATGLWMDDGAAMAIVENESGRMIGTVQFFVASPTVHGIEIGYIVHDPADCGHGYAAEATRLFSDLLWTTRPLDHRHQLVIEVGNAASWKTAERAGFVREGVLRSSGLGAGEPADSFVYSRTRSDHETGR